MYLLRMKDGPVWMTRLVDVDTQLAEIIAPVYREDPNVKATLFDFALNQPQPRVLAMFRYIDPEDENVIVFYVQTMSGANLFSFRFPLTP